VVIESLNKSVLILSGYSLISLLVLIGVISYTAVTTVACFNTMQIKVVIDDTVTSINNIFRYAKILTSTRGGNVRLYLENEGIVKLKLLVNTEIVYTACLHGVKHIIWKGFSGEFIEISYPGVTFNNGSFYLQVRNKSCRVYVNKMLQTHYSCE
jgi:hypothetical protein